MDESTNPPEHRVWIPIATVDEFESVTAKEFVVQSEVIAVFRVAGTFYAMDGLCAHQGGPIAKGTVGSGDEERPCVTCPWHGWQYELETGIQTVNRQPLQRTFPVRTRGDQIEICLKP